MGANLLALRVEWCSRFPIPNPGLVPGLNQRLLPWPSRSCPTPLRGHYGKNGVKGGLFVGVVNYAAAPCEHIPLREVADQRRFVLIMAEDDPFVSQMLRDQSLCQKRQPVKCEGREFHNRNSALNPL